MVKWWLGEDQTQSLPRGGGNRESCAKSSPSTPALIPQKSPVMSTEMFHRDVSQIFISSHVLFFLHLLFFNITPSGCCGVIIIS
jgi:hypothetical protein